MDDTGTTKDDVKVPDGEVGDKITKLFTTDGKDTSESTPFILTARLLTLPRRHCLDCHG